VNVVGNALHFSFNIPQGQEGLVGPAGPPFASAVVDSVTTLTPGDSATVGDPVSAAVLEFIESVRTGKTTAGLGGERILKPEGEAAAAATKQLEAYRLRVLMMQFEKKQGWAHHQGRDERESVRLWLQECQSGRHRDRRRTQRLRAGQGDTFQDITWNTRRIFRLSEAK